MRGLGRFVRTTAFKLSLIYLAVFAALSLFLIVSIADTTNDLLSRQLQDTIDAEIQGLAEQYRTGGVSRLIRVVEARSKMPGASLYLLTDFSGNVIAGNVSDLPSAVLSSADGIARPVPYRRLATDIGDEQPAVASHKALVRVFVLPGGFRLLVGRDLAEREQFRDVVWRAVKLSIGAVLLLGLVTWLFVSRRVLKRIDAVSVTAKQIMGGDLGGRLKVDGSGDEFDRLAESLNTMLDRIEQLMHGLKEVSDNIAHDLKTPLTRMRIRVEQALGDPNVGEASREALGATLEDCDGLIRTFEALLRIARVEAGSAGVRTQPVDVAEIAREVAELYEPVAEEQEATLTVTVPEVVVVAGDRDLLAQAVANLVDNALKYGRPADGSQRVSLTVTRDGEEAVIAVADNGPGVPEADRGRVTQRFVRLEGSRTAPGSGLGLSLVQAVASLHKGTLMLGDVAPGLVAELRLPVGAAGPK
ncbi:HAMP domain-containing sensor histidine kinase [Pseudoxanthobacter sp. M-2]|uniref:sensor histidine kinase n=1 Tax=Pseudoxanthobacter sp. M-2 TaxID=3078754 RepID=UPI0038FC37B4